MQVAKSVGITESRSFLRAKLFSCAHASMHGAGVEVLKFMYGGMNRMILSSLDDVDDEYVI